VRTLQSVNRALCTKNLRKNSTQRLHCVEGSWELGSNRGLEFYNNPYRARKRVGIGLLQRSASLRSLTESIPWN
jgi:hypothetical protein